MFQMFRVPVLLLFAAFSIYVPEDARASGITVAEVAMAAPDIVAIELRDPEFRRGRIVALPERRAGEVGRWIDVDGTLGLVIGPGGAHARLADTPPEEFLDRQTIDNAALYGAIGGRRVVSVHRKSMPYDSGIFRGPNGDTRTGAAFKHLIFLRLDSPLPEGDHVIHLPGDVVEDLRFTFDDRKTRALAIRSTQMGHRGADVSKVAFLALWLPAGDNEGAVDFRTYGIDGFEVIDGDGEVKFSGNVTLRKSPGDPEPGNGLAGPLVDYTSATAPDVRLRSLDRASGRLVTVEPHGLSEGQRLGLRKLGGDQDAAVLFATATEVTETALTLSEPSADLPQVLLPQATLVPAYRANRAGTFVFTLDYSAWQQEAGGQYRLRIPGLGVSDPFTIDSDIWLKAARNSMAGLYNQRSGIEIDGRFGYRRPVAFRPGADFTVLQSRLPLAWSSNFDAGFIPFEQGLEKSWRTGLAAPATYWGGYMDAGDWDRRIQHVEVAALLLDAFEALPTEKRNADFDIPRSSALLPDPAYLETDDLPDLLHEAIWVMDFFRRLQTSDGSISGGIESTAHPALGEPSYLERHEVYAYAPDHISTFKYAAVAAKLARILKGLGKETTAALFAESARAAWSAAERGFNDPDEYYRDAIRAAEEAGGLRQEEWPKRREALQELAGGYRAAAAAALHRLSPSAVHRDIFQASWRERREIFAYKGDAAWDYLMTPGADTALSAEIRAAFGAEAKLIADVQDVAAYPNMKHPFAPAGWGEGGAPDYHQMQTLMRAHILTGDTRLRRVMEEGYQAMVGVNQVGLSFVTGIGLRGIRHPLHEDHRAMGVDVPVGITIFGFAPQSATAYGWVFGPPWSPLPESGTAENAAYRRIEPPRFSMPFHEYLVEHPTMIMQQEYTVHQSIGTMATLAIYLHGQNGP